VKDEASSLSFCRPSCKEKVLRTCERYPKDEKRKDIFPKA
jgi:hypothetical protein